MAKPSEILASTTDSEAWNLEVERVAPKLKVTVRVDGRDWRSHLEQVNKCIFPFGVWPRHCSLIHKEYVMHH